MKEIFADVRAGESAPQLLTQLKIALESNAPYVLWLQGEMGAGKTSFVRSYLYSLGLDQATPVVSPTYTLMNEYRIGQQWYAHLDLYRAEAGFSLDELGVRDLRPFRGIFIEWPEQAGAAETLDATHILQIKWIDLNSRSYSLWAR